MFLRKYYQPHELSGQFITCRRGRKAARATKSKTYPKCEKIATHDISSEIPLHYLVNQIRNSLHLQNCGKSHFFGPIKWE